MSDLSHYLRARARTSRWLWLLAGALAVSSAGLGAAAYKSYIGQQQVQARIDQLRARQAAMAAAKPSRQDTGLQKRWAALKLEVDFPWDRVFQSLERADSKAVELLEFQPDKRNRTLLLRGEAKDEDALVAYLELLAMQAALANVHLLHEETTAHGRLETVSFEIKVMLVD